MKMTTEDYNELQDALRCVCTTFETTIARQVKVYANAGHSPKRMRWDMLHAVPSHKRMALFDKWYAYGYLNDSHIDTALRAITNTK